MPEHTVEKVQTRELSSFPALSTASETVQQWNNPKSNILRVAACFWSFIVTGSNDAAYGALIPYIQKFYSLTYLTVSLIFLSPFLGYTISAFLNDYIHIGLGQRGVAAISSGCHLASYIIISIHPPYPILVISFMVAGFGNGLAESAWNAWIGKMARSNQLLGFLHGFYGLGAVISPLISTYMSTRVFLPWYSFYHVMIGSATIEIISTTAAFWKGTGLEYKASLSGHSTTSRCTIRAALFTNPAARVTWICSVFLFVYVGIEVIQGGWIVAYMIQVRHGEPFASGITATGFWLGQTVGCIVLGFVTPKVGEKVAISVYLVIAMALELLLWLVPQFIVSAIAVGFQGFFIGPMFPAAVTAVSTLLPRDLHIGAIGFAAALGGSGAAVLPFITGAIAQLYGVQMLPPLLLALFGLLLGLWLGLPTFNKKG